MLPPHPGGYVLDDRYDFVRAATPADFITGTVCAGSNIAPLNDLNGKLELAVPPGPGQSYFYLVRAENGCGAGPAGYNSGGVITPARSCP
jgi:hypothetical protein